MINNSQPDFDRSAESSDSNFDAPVSHSGADDNSSASDSVGFGAGVDGGSTGTKKKPRRKPARKKTTRKKAPSTDDARDESGGGDDSAESKPSRSRKAKAKKATSRRRKAPAGEGDAGDAPRAEDSRGGDSRGEDSRGEDGGPTRKKRSRRRSKKTATSEADESTDEPRDEGDAFEGDDGEGKKKRRRRGSRGGRRRRKKDADDDAVTVDVLPGDDEDLPDLPPDAELVEDGASKKKRRRRRSRGKGGDDDAEAEEGEGSSRKKAKKKSSKKKAKRTRKSAPEKGEDEPEVEEVVARTQMILVNAVDPEEKRVAVVDGERITDLLMTSDSQKSLVNDIYRGRVVNLEPAIGAAFVDFGQGRNGFLHTSDVLAIYGEKGFTLDQLLTSKVDPEDWDDAPSQPSIGEEVDDDDEDEDGETTKAKKGSSGGKKSSTRRRRGRERQPISDLLKVGDQVVVQVTKDAIGDKGPTLTTYISIPGRYLVLMPSMARTGVSRKIPDDKERRRLKRILTSINTPEDMGVIVRTAGVGKTKKDLQRDLNYLLGVWDSFGRRVTKGRGPAPLYQESNVAIRTLRDLFGPLTKEVVIDDPVVHEELITFAEKLMPEHTDRIVHHEAERPIFHHYGIEQDFEKVFVRRVELPSGGSIVFDQAEALVAIDVNSGRTRTNSFDFEEIALKTNLEAVPEIARQIRLRDLGGIIVCDFIDMMKGSSNRTVERALRAGLAGDRARSKLGRISQFGLLEMTRQRLGPGTHKKVFQTCPRCRGTARIRTSQSRAQAILRRLGSALTQKGFTTVEVRAHPEVVEYLTEKLWDYVRALEHRFEKEVKLTSVPDQPEDSVLRYLRADGREVRPGGRRKR